MCMCIWGSEVDTGCLISKTRGGHNILVQDALYTREGLVYALCSSRIIASDFYLRYDYC